VFFAETLTPKLSGPTHNSDHGRHVGTTDGRILKSGTMFVPNFMEIPINSTVTERVVSPPLCPPFPM